MDFLETAIKKSMPEIEKIVDNELMSTKNKQYKNPVKLEKQISKPIMVGIGITAGEMVKAFKNLAEAIDKTIAISIQNLTNP